MREMLGQLKFNRRSVLISLISSAPLAVLSFGTTKAVAKVAQRGVQYQPTPKGGQACAGCNSFIAPNQCKLVAGEISPSGWCGLWTKREG
jgi:hypothetical protein